MLAWLAILVPLVAAAAPPAAPVASAPQDPAEPKIALPQPPALPAAATAKPAVERPAPSEADKSVPAALGAPALCAELSRSAKARAEEIARIENEKAALAAERAELQKLARQIETARAQLREETDRLASFVDLASEESKPGSSGYWRNRLAKAGPTTVPADSFETLAKTVKAMKPAAAAELVSKLDRHLGAAVLERLRPQDASAVLDRIKPDLAAELFNLLAQRAALAREAKK